MIEIIGSLSKMHDECRKGSFSLLKEVKKYKKILDNSHFIRIIHV
jgi:hypothetical protein